MLITSKNDAIVENWNALVVPQDTSLPFVIALGSNVSTESVFFVEKHGLFYYQYMLSALHKICSYLKFARQLTLESDRN